MEFESRILLISKIAQLVPSIRKTAMMKCIYLLDAIEKVPTNYNFEIYTYGPYSSQVMEEIDFARQKGYIAMSGVLFPDGKYGYSINCTSQAENCLANSHELDKYLGSITKIANEFGQKPAKSLELIATIVFVDYAYSKTSNQTVGSVVCESVKRIKPHFSADVISNEYSLLQQKGYLKTTMAS